LCIIFSRSNCERSHANALKFAHSHGWTSGLWRVRPVSNLQHSLPLGPDYWTFAQQLVPKSFDEFARVEEAIFSTNQDDWFPSFCLSRHFCFTPINWDRQLPFYYWDNGIRLLASLLLQNVVFSTWHRHSRVRSEPVPSGLSETLSPWLEWDFLCNWLHQSQKLFVSRPISTIEKLQPVGF